MSSGPSSFATSEPWRLGHLLFAVFGVALFLGSFMAIGGWAVVLLILIAFAGAVGAVVVMIRGRAGQRYSFLWTLAIAADHGLPLATTVAASAGQYRGRFGLRVARLASRLDAGAGLGDALEAVRGLVPADLALLIRSGEESGSLGPALRKAASLQMERSEMEARVGSQAAYLAGVFYVIAGVVSFLLYFIIPKFEAIFQDFGVSLPASTVFLIGVSHQLVRVLAPIWLPLLVFSLMYAVPIVLSVGSTYSPPLIGRLFRRRHAALILRCLATAAAGGRPIEKALQTLADRYPTRWVRKRLLAVEREVDRGEDWREALLRRRLIRPTDHEVLTSASGVGNLAWAMGDLADAIDRRRRLRGELLTQALWPIVVLAIGVLVLFLAVGFFSPLVELIGRLS